MTNETVNKTADNASKIARISTLLESLKKKVKNFAVLDREGQVVGEVRNLLIDANRQLTFVISTSENQESNRFFLLKGKLVQKIDSENKGVFINIDKSQIQYLPEYVDKESQLSEVMEDNLNAQEANPDNTTPIATVANNTSTQIESVIPGYLEEDDVVEDIIRLLGERLVIDRSKRKIGEVIVRKEIETRMIQVPVRHERLIIEQVSPERKQLAEIDLGLEEISSMELNEGETPVVDSFDNSLSVSGEFNSPKIASLLLNAIALERNHGCLKVRVTVVVEDQEHQKTYQEWFARTSNSEPSDT